MTSRTTSLFNRERLVRTPDVDIVSASEDRQRVSGTLRAAVGFRVEGRDGRVGLLSAVARESDDALPDTIRVTRGLFNVRAIDIPFADVIRVDPRRRRVHISTLLEPDRVNAVEIARRLRRFRRAGGR